jgi:hypothetical protein
MLDCNQTAGTSWQDAREKSRSKHFAEFTDGWQLVGNSKEFDVFKDYKNLYEQELPPTGAVAELDGLQMADW